MKPVSSTEKMHEHQFQQVKDLGIAWNSNRVWVCLNGVSLFRAKVMGGKFLIEFTPPEKE